MRSTTFLTATSMTVAWASAQSATNNAQFSSAASQLISLYIPSPAASAIVSVAHHHHIHGAPASILESAFTATATPSWLTAVPVAYQSNIQSLESAVSALRGAVSVGSISGAPRVVTSTDAAGGVVVTTRVGGGAGASSSTATPSTSASSSGSAASAGSSSATSGSTLVTMTGTVSQESSATLIATGFTSSTSSGLAMATHAPCVAAGLLGFIGVVAAL